MRLLLLLLLQLNTYVNNQVLNIRADPVPD